MGAHPKNRIIPLFIPHMGCPHRCSFCDQRSISGESSPVTPESVRRELSEVFALPPPEGEKVEIAFYGGSFTALPEGEMEAFLREAEPYLLSGQAGGIRCSTRPDAITPEIIRTLLRYGVHTVELGAQSLSDDVLQKNLRGHTAQDVRRAFSLLKDAGFTVGLQMMTGLPGDTAGTLAETVEEILRLHPDMLRVYPTVVLRGTLLDHWREEGSFTPMGLPEAVRVCAGILERMETAGIPVIRMGLHASPSIEREMTGGAYHPAFKELCQSELFYQKVSRTLAGALPGSSRTLLIHPRDCSRAVGQKRENLRRWEALGVKVTVQESESIPQGSFLLKE